MTTYHTLVQFDGDTWMIEFGDYDLQTVQDELEDYADKDEADRALLRIVTTASDSAIEIENAVAALEAPKAFTLQISDFIPRGLHVTIYADSYEAAMAEGRRMIDEDDIEWEHQQSWDNDCTKTRITEICEGPEEMCSGNVMTQADIIALHKAIAQEVAPAALPAPGAYTVIVRHPDYANQHDWGGTHQSHVFAETPSDAIAMGQLQAALATGRDPETDDWNSELDDWAVVAVFAGHLESFAPEP